MPQMPKRRRALLTTAALLCLPGTALAQAQAGAQASPDTNAARDAQGAASAETASSAAAAQPAEARDREIVVTGSRIARPEFKAPNPITSFNAAAIQQSGNTNITNFLQRVPALNTSRDTTQTSGGGSVSTGSASSFGTAGLNELDLRNLGTNRTLVLVNGRRHVAGEANSAAVDINSIPTDLIERVDVLTGGASAVYGADGVSGVVNFILKRDFDGISARTQFGISRYGDAGNRFASVIGGRNFGEGRGNITLAYEYNANDPVTNDDRPFLRQDRRRYLIPNDADVGDSASIPDNVLVGDLHYTDISPNGAVFVGGEAIPSLDGLGRPYDRGRPVAYYFQGGESTGVAGFFQGDLFAKIERHDANLLTHYDFSDAFKLSVEAKFVQTRARTFGQYSETFYVPFAIANPLVPANIRSQAIAAGADTVYVNRDNIDYGRQGEDDLRRTYRGVVDASGRISEHATWDAYFEYGRTSIRFTRLNDRLADQFTQTLDAVVGPNGQLACRSGTAGCIPVSLFGPGPISRDQLAFFQIDDASHALVTQQVASASVSGDFGAIFKLPGGPVQFSFGGEYRRETSRFQPSDNLLNNRFFQFDEPALVTANRGKFDVKEAFGELNAPILQEVPLAYALSVGAAGRYSHYSTVGDTKTWQFNGIYAPIRDISFRGSYGKSVRAPNIGELFRPNTGDSSFFTDPCTPAEINNGTEFRAANCRATLAAVGAVSNPGLQTGQFIQGSSSGNPDLKAEVARTWTAGAVFRPRFLPGFTGSFDWYDINLKNAINTVTPGDLANLCVDTQTLDNPFCPLISRQQGTGIINGYAVSVQNVANFRTAGADINIDYTFRTARAGSFDLRLVAGYVRRLEFVGIPDAPVTDNRDLGIRSRWNFNFSPTWTLGGLTVNYNLRWTDKTRLVDRNTTAGNPDYAEGRYLRNPSLVQHDVQVQYQLRNGFAFYTGVNNLTDQKPNPASFGTNIPISPLGRFFYAGAKINLSRR